jgi:hypothetical protein
VLRRVLREIGAVVRAREEAALLRGSPTPTPDAPESAESAEEPAGPLRLLAVFAADAARAVLETTDPATRRSGLDDLRYVTRRGPGHRVHLVGWWRGPGRLLDDLGPMHRDDIGAWVAVGVPGSELFSLAGNRSVTTPAGPNRAVLFDRAGPAEPRTIVPFAPVGQRVDPR